MKQRILRPNDDAAPATSSKPASRIVTPKMPLPPFVQGSRETGAQAGAEAHSVEMTIEDKPATDVPEVETPAVTPEQASGRDLRYIPVQLIDPNPLAPREVYTPQMIRDRADALRDQGQHDAIHVIPNPEAPGRFVIADGWTRVQACVDHKVLDTLLAQVHSDLSLEDAAWFGYQQNEEREQHCDLDRAMFYAKLMAGGAMSAAEVGRRAGKSKAQMARYGYYAKLPETVLDIVREAPGKFGSHTAEALHKVFAARGQAKAVALAQRYKDEDQTVRWLVAQAEMAIAPPGHKPKSQAKNWRFGNGFLKQRGDTFDMQVQVPAERRDQFAEALEQLLATVAVEPAGENAE